LYNLLRGKSVGGTFFEEHANTRQSPTCGLQILCQSKLLKNRLPALPDLSFSHMCKEKQVQGAHRGSTITKHGDQIVKLGPDSQDACRSVFVFVFSSLGSVFVSKNPKSETIVPKQVPEFMPKMVPRSPPNGTKKTPKTS
jgi:hypothetical protein